MKVMAVPGIKCPKEGKPRFYISDSIPVDVPDSPYYRRLIADGSLVLADAPASANKSKGGK